MRFTRIREDEDLAKVVRRMYRSEAKGALAEAEKLVIGANPQLRDPSAVRPGAIVIVPDVPGTRAIDEGEGEGEVPMLTSLVANALRGLDDLGSFLDPVLAAEEEELSRSLAVLKSREVQALASKEPDAKKRVGDIQKQSEERLQSFRILRGTQKTALGELQIDRAALLKMLDELPGA